MQHEDFLYALDDGILQQLLPLGDSVIGALVTLITAAITYTIGKARSSAEVDNLKAEKKKIEAASGVSTAEAAQIISEAAASTVQPLLERIREQREDIRFLTDRNVTLRDELDTLRITAARLRSENEILRAQVKIQGNDPDQKPEVK